MDEFSGSEGGSPRNQVETSVARLRGETAAGSDELDHAVSGFLGLAVPTSAAHARHSRWR